MCCKRLQTDSAASGCKIAGPRRAAEWRETMLLLQGFLHYLLYALVYGAVAFAGVIVGIRVRKNKNGEQ